MRINLRLSGYLGLRERLSVLNDNIIVKVNDVIYLEVLSTVDMRLHRRITQRLIAFSVTDTNDWTQCTRKTVEGLTGQMRTLEQL